MNSQVSITLLTGVLCIGASFCVGLLEIMSGPDRPNYPTMRKHVRVALFLWAALLCYRGIEIVHLALLPRPQVVTPGAAVATMSLAIVQAMLLEQHLRMWLPARLHNYIRRMLHLASCGHSRQLRAARVSSNAATRPGVRDSDVSTVKASAALATLSAQGAEFISGPGERPTFSE